eukprot:1458380-Prymnesium_polylepis.2
MRESARTGLGGARPSKVASAFDGVECFAPHKVGGLRDRLLEVSCDHAEGRHSSQNARRKSAHEAAEQNTSRATRPIPPQRPLGAASVAARALATHDGCRRVGAVARARCRTDECLGVDMLIEQGADEGDSLLVLVGQRARRLGHFRVRERERAHLLGRERAERLRAEAGWRVGGGRPGRGWVEGGGRVEGRWRLGGGRVPAGAARAHHGRLSCRPRARAVVRAPRDVRPVETLGE